MINDSSPILGHWRIIEMEMWDQGFVDAEGSGFIRFDRGGSGEFHFGYVHGQMTCEHVERDGAFGVEWSWYGNDEMHEASGRGCAVLKEDGRLTGKLVFDGGDASDFTAVRTTSEQSGLTVQAEKISTGRVVRVDASDIRQGKIVHPDLPLQLLARIQAIHERIRDYYDATLEQFELSFMRDSDPEGEIAVWERIVVAFERVTGALPDLDPKMILRTLLGYSMDALSAEEMAAPDVRRIIKVVEED